MTTWTVCYKFLVPLCCLSKMHPWWHLVHCVIHCILMPGLLILHKSTEGTYQNDQKPSSQIESVPQGLTLCFLNDIYASLLPNNGQSQAEACFTSILNYLICLPHCISIFHCDLYFPPRLIHTQLKVETNLLPRPEPNSKKLFHNCILTSLIQIRSQ